MPPTTSFSPLALILIPVGYLFLWPLVDRWLKDDALAGLPLALTSFALSIGTLALVMFWVGMLPGRWLVGPLVLAVIVLGLGIGVALNPRWLAPQSWRSCWRSQWQQLVRLDAPSLLEWAILGSSAVILVNALYYPFLGDDVLVRYAPQARAIALAGHIPESVWGYPPLVPLGFVATWFAAGGLNEHLARLLPAVMALGTLGATYLVGRQIAGRLAGLLAAALVALTPMFVNNAVLAYTDIPAAFPLTLAMFFALRWWESGRVRDAVLVGLFISMALLTKQSALTCLVSFAAVPVLRLAAPHRKWSAAMLGLAGILLPPLLLSGPWYLRNVLIGGWNSAVPIAGEYHLLGASFDWRGAIPALLWPQAFGLPLVPVWVLGWVSGLAGAVLQASNVLRGRTESPPADLIIAGVVLPYWLAWWARFSFDPRFLLLVLPLLAVWSVRPLERIIRWVAARVKLSTVLQQALGSLLLGVLLVWGTRDQLGGVYRAVTQPFASDEQKLLAVKGSMYWLVLYARDHLDPQQDRLYLIDERLAYYLDEFDTVAGYPLTLSDLDGFDFLFHSSSIYAVYGDGLLGWDQTEFYLHAFDPLIFEPVYVSGGVHVMRILRTTIPTQQEYDAYYAAHPVEP